MGTVGGLLAAQVPRDLPSGSRELGALALFLLFCGMFAFSLRWLRRGEWFHPWAFPILYLLACCTLPIAFLIGFNEPLANPGIDPLAVTPRLIAVFGLTAIGLIAGIAAGLRLPRLRRSDRATDVDFGGVLSAGRGLLVVALAARLFVFVNSYGVTYGQGSVAFGLAGALEAIANVVVFAAIVLIVFANVRLERRTLAPADLALLALFVLATLAVGSRGELLAPALFILWAHHAYVRRISFGAVAVTAAIVLVVFQGVSGTRVNEPFLQSPKQAVQRSLGSVATPVQVQSLLMTRVPARQPQLGGSTYTAALVRQAPGPVASSVLGQPTDTGSFEFRRIMGITSPHFGLGFAFPSEAYLNFDLVGVAIAALLLGGLLAFAYRQRAAVPARAIHVLYGILIATLPIGFRSDAVEHMKIILYPMLLLTVVLYLFGRPRASGRLG